MDERRPAGGAVAAASSIARGEGPDKLSMRHVAARLDVDPAALYWHFQNKDALLEAISLTAADDTFEFAIRALMAGIEARIGSVGA